MIPPQKDEHDIDERNDGSEEKKRMRRQIIGAAVLFSIAAGLWTIDAPPPAAPNDDAIVDIGQTFVVDERDAETIVETLIEEDTTSFLEISEDAVVADDEQEALVDESPTESVTTQITQPEVAVIEPVEPAEAVAVQADEDSKVREVADDTLRLRVGVFRRQNNIENVVKALQDEGFSTDTQQTAVGTEIYVVDLADDAAKQRAKKRVDNLLNAKPAAPKNNASKTADKTPAAGAVAMQVGAFRQRQRLDKVKSQLEAEQFNVVIVPTERNGLSLFRVLVVLENAQAAPAAKQRLSKLGYDKAYVVEVDL